jgi:hypothetical protein
MAACAKAPYDQLDAAEKAVRDARTAGAPIYVPQDFQGLEASLEAAKEEIETQYKLSEFKRDYTRADTLLADTRALGERLIAESHKRKEQAKAVALRDKEEAKEAVQEVRQLVERAEQTASSPVQKVSDEIKAEAEELNRSLAEVQTAIEANNHLVAQNKAKAVQEKSQELLTQVRGAQQ